MSDFKPGCETADAQMSIPSIKSSLLITQGRGSHFGRGKIGTLGTKKSEIVERNRQKKRYFQLYFGSTATRTHGQTHK